MQLSLRSALTITLLREIVREDEGKAMEEEEVEELDA